MRLLEATDLGPQSLTEYYSKKTPFLSSKHEYCSCKILIIIIIINYSTAIKVTLKKLRLIRILTEYDSKKTLFLSSKHEYCSSKIIIIIIIIIIINYSTAIMQSL